MKTATLARCTSCDWAMIQPRKWLAAHPETRTHWLNTRHRKAGARGMCSACAQRERRGLTPRTTIAMDARCVTCEREMVPEGMWRAATDEQRAAWKAAGKRRYGSRGECNACRATALRKKAPSPRVTVTLGDPCNTCDRRLVPPRTWAAANKTQRAEWTAQRHTKASRVGECSACMQARVKGLARPPHPDDVTGTCGDCGRLLIRKSAWAAATVGERTSWRARGHVKRVRPDQCEPCYYTEWRAPDAKASRDGRKARAMRTEGHTVADIATALGIDETTAHRYTLTDDSPDVLDDGRFVLNPGTRVLEWVAA